MAIDPEYGVPLTADELNSQIPTSILYAVTPDNKFVPVKATEDGTLAVDATFEGSITVGEIGAPDKDPFIYGTSLTQPIGGVFQDTNPSLTAGKQGAVRLTQFRAFHVNLRDSSGVEIDPATEATATSILTALDQFTFASGRLVIDGSQVTQPISGSVSVSNFPAVQPVSGTVAVSNFPAVQPISATSLPLPTNAAQETGGNLASIKSGIDTLNSLVPSVYDYISLNYSGNNLTQAKFYLGGPSGTLISTLTLMYTGNNLTSVQKS